MGRRGSISRAYLTASSIIEHKGGGMIYVVCKASWSVDFQGER